MGFKFVSLYFITILLILFGVTSSSKVNAQVSTDILVNMVPPFPAPYENVNITLKSYAYDLDSVLISWSINDTTMASGIGKKLFSATAPGAGEETNVVATIYLPAGAIEQKITIRPSVMVLLWQANDSHVPPFYKGKALATPDSEIKIVAMPEIRTSSGLVDSKNMTYAWKQDYNNNVDGSGYGKNFFVYINDYLEDSNSISVTASTLDQNYSNQANISIGTTQPKILFYKYDDALGTIWEKTLSNPHKIQEKELVEAVPYFISPKELLHPMLVWNWFINDSKVDLTSLKKNLMPLQTKEGTHGTSKLRLEIQNTGKIFQTSEKEINIEF